MFTIDNIYWAILFGFLSSAFVYDVVYFIIICCVDHCAQIQTFERNFSVVLYANTKQIRNRRTEIPGSRAIDKAI